MLTQQDPLFDLVVVWLSFLVIVSLGHVASLLGVVDGDVSGVL